MNIDTKKIISKSANAEKIYGCLMAGAIGDALGYEVEFMDYPSIQKQYGSEGIRNLVLHGGKAHISDDTQMTLFTNDAMIRAS